MCTTREARKHKTNNRFDQNHWIGTGNKSEKQSDLKGIIAKKPTAKLMQDQSKIFNWIINNCNLLISAHFWVICWVRRWLFTGVGFWLQFDGNWVTWINTRKPIHNGFTFNVRRRGKKEQWHNQNWAAEINTFDLIDWEVRDTKETRRNERRRQ